MTNFATIEEQIKAEYNKVDAFIALRPKLSVAIALAIGLLLGHIV